MRRSLLLTGLGVLVVALHGLLHGWSSGRWSGPAEIQVSAARLQQLPLRIGDWQGEDLHLDPKRQALAGIQGYVMRRYVHRRLGTALSLLIVCGRHGPISVHTPDVCYRGAGFEMQTPEVRQSVGAGQAEFWRGDFRRHGESADQLRIFWAWNDGRGWRAPDRPRFAFGGAPVLFKLYVVQEVVTGGAGAASEAADFLGALLPVLDQVLLTR